MALGGTGAGVVGLAGDGPGAGRAGAQTAGKQPAPPPAKSQEPKAAAPVGGDAKRQKLEGLVKSVGGAIAVRAQAKQADEMRRADQVGARGIVDILAQLDGTIVVREEEARQTEKVLENIRKEADALKHSPLTPQQVDELVQSSTSVRAATQALQGYESGMRAVRERGVGRPTTDAVKKQLDRREAQRAMAAEALEKACSDARSNPEALREARLSLLADALKSNEASLADKRAEIAGLFAKRRELVRRLSEANLAAEKATLVDDQIPALRSIRQAALREQLLIELGATDIPGLAIPTDGGAAKK